MQTKVLLVVMQIQHTISKVQVVVVHRQSAKIQLAQHKAVLVALDAQHQSAVHQLLMLAAVVVEVKILVVLVVLVVEETAEH